MKTSELTFEKFRELTLENIKEIADSFKVKSGIVFIDTRLKDGDVKITITPKEFGKLPKDNESRYRIIKKLYDDGLTQAEVARVTELSQPMISKILKIENAQED